MDSEEIATALTAALLQDRKIRLDERTAGGIAAFWRHLVSALDQEQEMLASDPQRSGIHPG